MNRVIIPIYPDETERKYNAHIKSQALAGCHEDKKWYGYSGALIYNKYGNPQPAKALSWVVDKKMQELL